jgi:hypothetical protein
MEKGPKLFNQLSRHICCSEAKTYVGAASRHFLGNSWAMYAPLEHKNILEKKMFLKDIQFCAKVLIVLNSKSFTQTGIDFY